MNVRYQYAQQAVDDKVVTVSYVPTDRQKADGLTKALKMEPFRKWRALIGQI